MLFIYLQRINITARITSVRQALLLSFIVVYIQLRVTFLYI